MKETWVRSLDWEDPLEKGTAIPTPGSWICQDPESVRICLSKAQTQDFSSCHPACRLFSLQPVIQEATFGSQRVLRDLGEVTLSLKTPERVSWFLRRSNFSHSYWAELRTRSELKLGTNAKPLFALTCPCLWLPCGGSLIALWALPKCPPVNLLLWNLSGPLSRLHVCMPGLTWDGNLASHPPLSASQCFIIWLS